MKYILLFLFTLSAIKGYTQQAGTLDVTFDNDGMLKDIGDHIGERCVVQNDGKIVSAGRLFSGTDAFVRRYNSNGTVDVSYGTNGSTNLSVLSNSTGIQDILLQPDGKLVVVGSTGDGFTLYLFLARFNTNGTLDNTFGNGGIVMEQMNGDATHGYSIALQDNGKIIALSSISTAIYQYDVVLMRFHGDGSLDNSFDTDGKALIPLGSEQPTNGGLAIQQDGKILVGTTLCRGMQIPGDHNYVVLRVDDVGQPDLSFGTGGKTITDFGSGMYDQGYNILLQQDGKSVLTGYQWNGIDFNLSAARYTASGVLDASFGNGGLVVIGQQYDDVSYNSFLQPDGKILLSGNTSFNGHAWMLLARLNTDGSPDNAFAAGGILATDIETQNNNNASGVALQPDGKIVCSGYTRVCTNGTCGPLCLAMIRVHSDLFTGIINAQVSEQLLSVYPNPVTGKTLMFRNESENLLPFEIRIFDPFGRKVYSTSIPSGTQLFHIDLPPALSRGLYSIESGSSDHASRLKLIIE